MGDRSVNTAAAPAANTRARLKPEFAALTQGLVASHFAHLPAAEALFLALPERAGGAWLQALRQQEPISAAAGSREDDSAAAIAFSCSGLARMNLPTEALESFSAPFREGMHQIDRQRRLRDDPKLGTVVTGGVQWGGNMPDPYLPESDKPAPAPITVHAVLLLYAPDDRVLQIRLDAVEALLSEQQVRVVHRRRLSLRADARGISREHFGFADGMSQPVPMGDAIEPATGASAAAERRWHGVPVGEILLGHPNIHHEPAPGPIVAASADTSQVLDTAGAPDGFCNLGLNGSYLVVRELLQDVAGFWQSMDRAAQTLGRSEVEGARIDGRWLAERIVGRTLDGDPLRPGGVLAPQDGAPATNFGYAHEDVHGFGCPLGAHIRRANPRDSLPSRDSSTLDLAQSSELLDAANAHRILRRGRKFGPDLADPRHDDGQVRGLMFMCLNSDLVRHFEFVQQTWLLNPNFATLLDETDPLLGPPPTPVNEADHRVNRMTIPARPVRLRPKVETYVQLYGGEYFFLPSLPALDYLGSLRPAAQP